MAPVASPGGVGPQEPPMGFWGPRTSTLDWCESNYATSDYIAEFWNTISNIVFILPPIFGIYFAWRDKVEARFILSYIGMIIIGIGSISFHLTLRILSQMLDEMSMLWSTSFFLYCMMETNSKPRSTNGSLVQVLYIYNAFTSLSYLILQRPLFFQVAYGLLTVILISKAVYLAINQDCNSWLLKYVVVLYVFAFALWNIDNLCCEYMQLLRYYLPRPLSGLTELHAWWHVLVGIACHAQIQFSCHLRSSFLKRRSTVWTWCGFLPFLKVHDEEHSRDAGTLTSLPSTRSQSGGADDISRKVSPKEGVLLRSRLEKNVADKLAIG